MITCRNPLLHLLAILSLACPAGAQSVTQEVVLNPGWNAVWLEVEPEENSTDEVFAGLAVGSVWTWLDRASPAQFVQSVSEKTFDESGWQRWFPSSREESILNNLFRIQVNRAYLIRFDGPAPVTWNLTGRPSVREAEWSPDTFTLRGLPVDPEVPPSFADFFRHSPAHFDQDEGQIRPIYKLDSASGSWLQVGGTDQLESGHAYWIFTQGASDFSAPLDLSFEIGDGLDFGLEANELELRVLNRRSTLSTALLTDSAGGSGILSYLEFDPTQGNRWLPLPDPLALPVTADGALRLELAVRRQDQSAATQVSVLEIRDGAGSRHLVPVSSDKLGVAALERSSDTNPLAGLWVGSATLNAVSEAHASDVATPTPTPSEMSLRMILHVDSAGEVRLLKEVTQMWREGILSDAPGGDQQVDVPGEYVLLTDDSLIPQFSGAVARDGEAVGRRLSTVGYEFESPPEENYLALSGSFGIGNSLSGTLSLPSDHPTNPFKHKYHPDHDNLNNRFDGPADESFDVTRELSLTFGSAPPTGQAAADFGYNEMAGSYRETITGIHKNPLNLAGSFFLRRISTISELNPTPNP